MKKNIALRMISSLLAAAVLLSPAACSSGGSAVSSGSSSAQEEKTPQDGGDFVYGLQTQPRHLNPYLNTSADTRVILFNIFEGLVKPDKDGNLNPAVAESYTTSDDAASYTFKLRPGVKFQTGKAVTADDVVYSLSTAAGLKTGKPLVAGLKNIKSVEAKDASTVTIHLKEADYDFLPELTVAILPKGYTEQDTHPIGTGPYMFESYSPQQKLVLKKNPYYWQKGLPHFDKVTFKLESDSNALLTDLQGGSVDGASIANNVASQLGSEFQVIASNSNSVQLLALNNKTEPFNNADVRRAVCYAVNPDEIIQTVDFGKGVRCGSPVIPGLKKYCDTSLAKAYNHNTAKAKQLLAKAGYPNGFSMSITVPSNYTVHVETAQVIVNELKEVGIKATIHQVDFATWLSKAYHNREYQSTIVSVDGATLSPRSYLSRYVSDSDKNFTNYSSAAYDALYRKAETEKDETKRIALYKQAQKMLSDDAASVYIQDISNLNALKNGISGFTAYPLYVFDAASLYRTK